MSVLHKVASSVANLAIFPRNCACFFSDMRYFEGLQVACFEAGFICKLLIFQILWNFCVFCVSLLILGLFSDLCCVSFLIYLLVFVK